MVSLLVANSGALFDRAIDGIPRHGGAAGLFHDRKKTGISLGIRPAQFRGDHDFFDELADHHSFSEVGDFTFSLEPLATHVWKKYEGLNF